MKSKLTILALLALIPSCALETENFKATPGYWSVALPDTPNARYGTLLEQKTPLVLSDK